MREIKQQLIDAAHRAYRIGLQRGTGGNVSVRLPGTNRVAIKASGCSFGECRLDNLVLVDMDGEKMEGNGLPSKELRTHLMLYRTLPDAGGIFHCHSPWAIAVAEIVKEIPLLSFHSKVKLGRIAVVETDGSDEQEMAHAVESLVSQQPELKAFVHRRHGIFAVGRTIALAEHNAELVEETAQIAYLVEAMETHPVKTELEAQ